MKAYSTSAPKPEREIAALQPRDRIDVQSFIWVVGKYRVEHEGGLG
jgi:hypothetical protein